MQRHPLGTVRVLVSERVVQALDEHTASFAPLGAPLVDLLSPARDLLGGGKRLRALLCAVGWAGTRGDLSAADEPAPVGAGASLELFQAAALVHDDVMDGSLLRRGMPAAHRQYAAEHAREGWLGDAEQYGQGAAILLGDLLLTASSMELDRARAHAPGSEQARTIYDLMVSEVAVGQYLDIRAQALPWEVDAAGAVDRAMQVLRHKSARYSVEHPLVLGAALAGASDAQMARMRAVGLPLGEAFQLRDDDLGVFGEPEVTGKPAGDDLREGKRTVLVGLALDRLDADGRAYLQRTLGRPDLDDGDVERLRQLLRSSEAVAAHERLITERYTSGLRAIEAAELDAEVRAALVDLAGALTRRSA